MKKSHPLGCSLGGFGCGFKKERYHPQADDNALQALSSFSGRNCRCHIHTAKPLDKLDNMNCRNPRLDRSSGTSAVVDNKDFDIRHPIHSDFATARLFALIPISGSKLKAYSTPGIRQHSDALKSSIMRFSATNPALY